MAERSFIDSYLQGDGTNSISSLSKGLLDNAFAFQGVITSLAPELIHTDAEVRARGTRLIADLVHALPGTFLKEAEVAHVCTFFCDRLKDQHVVIPHVLFGILALVRFHPLQGSQAAGIVQVISKEVHVQALIRVDRSVVYNIIHGLLEKYMQGLLTMGPDFVFAFIQMMDGEQDPRNLLLAFNLVPTIAQSFPIDRFIEDLFDVTSCYFPISFTPQPDDPTAITQDQLVEALRRCLCATPAFAALTVPLLLEKLTSAVAGAKLDSVTTLSAGAPVFGAQALGPFVEGVWLALRTEVFRASSESLVNACLDCVTILTKVFSSDSSQDKLKDLIERILKECCHHFKQPQLGLSNISCQILAAACAGSDAGCALILADVIPVIIEQYAVHPTSVLQCSLMDSLRSLVGIAATYHSQMPAKPVLVLHTDSVLSVIFTSINDGDANVRVFGCKCMAELLSSSSVLGAAQVSLCIEHILRVLQNDEAAEVRVHGQRLAVCVCCHFPDIGLHTIVPSVSEWLQLRRTACDAGLKAHVTEKYVLDLTAQLASSVQLLPVLIELWLGQLEHIARGEWSEELAQRCHILLDTLYSGLAESCRDVSVLDIVWQPIALQLVECLLTAAKSSGDQVAVQSLLFSHLPIVQSASRLIGTLVRSATASRQTDLVSQLVAAVCQSGDLSPFMAAALPRQSQVIVLLAAVLPGVQPSALPDSAFNLLPPCVDMALSSAHSESALSACVVAATLLNKISDESALASALQSTTAVISSSLESGAVQHAVQLLAWVTRGMVLRSHPSCLELSAKLISLFTADDTKATAAAAAFSLLLNDDASRNMTQAGGATVKFLYKQKFFVQIRTQLVDGFKQASDGPMKDHFLTALSHLLFSVPEQVLLSEIPPLLPLVIQCLSSTSAQLVMSSLTAVMALMSGAPALLGQYASDLIPLLIKLSRFKGNMKLRQSSLKCLGAMTVLPHHLLYPHKNRVVQELVACLDDHKRLVRGDAVECRTKWLLLGSAPS